MTLNFLSFRKLSLGLLTLCCCLVMATDTSRAQDAAPATAPSEREKELDERISILEKEKKKAELEKDVAVTQTEHIRALLPKPSTTPLTGKVEIDENVKLESKILAYQALSELLRTLSGRISKLNAKPQLIVIHNDKEVAALQNYSAVKAQIDATAQRYGQILPGGAEAGPAGILLAPEVASTFLRSVIDVAALFRTDTVIDGLTFTVEEGALVSQLSRDLQDAGIAVYYPLVYPPNLLSDSIPVILKSLSDLYVQKSKSELVVFRCESTVNEIKALCTINKENIAESVARLKALNKQVDEFIDDLSKVDETTKTSALAALVKAENLRNLLQQNGAYFLQLKVLDAAGSNKRTSNLFTGTKLSHSGGIVVNFILFDNRGAIKLSDTLYNYNGFVRVKSKEGNLLNNLQ